MQPFSVDKRIVAEAMAIHLLPWQRTVYLYPGHNPWQRNGGANDNDSYDGVIRKGKY